MRDLSVAQQQQIEIAKAISQDARIIVMDEPTSAITEDDVGNLFEQIRELTDNGVGIIYISHKMNEISRSRTGSLSYATARSSARTRPQPSRRRSSSP